jgi:CRP/FNR family transcriptional regulator
MEIFDFYHRLDKQSKEFLKINLKPVKANKENLLFFQGEICKDILFLTKGSIKVFIQSDKSDKITLYNLTPGQQCIVNTASALSQTEAIGSAETLTDIEGFTLNVKYVKQLACKSDEYQKFLFSIYTLRMNDLAELVNDIKFKKLEDRVYKWLKKQNKKTILTTQENIAEEMGSNRVVITRILKKLKEKNLIKYHRNCIKVL